MATQFVLSLLDPMTVAPEGANLHAHLSFSRFEIVLQVSGSETGWLMSWACRSSALQCLSPAGQLRAEAQSGALAAAQRHAPKVA